MKQGFLSLKRERSGLPKCGKTRSGVALDVAEENPEMPLEDIVNWGSWS